MMARAVIPRRFTFREPHSMNTDPQPANERSATRSDGPLGGLLNRIPLQSRLAVTLGVVIGMIASIVSGGLEEVAGQVALGIGIGGGFIAAVLLAMRSNSNRDVKTPNTNSQTGS